MIIPWAGYIAQPATPHTLRRQLPRVVANQAHFESSKRLLIFRLAMCVQQSGALHYLMWLNGQTGGGLWAVMRSYVVLLNPGQNGFELGSQEGVAVPLYCDPTVREARPWRKVQQ